MAKTVDWSNKEYVLEAVKQDGYALDFAGEELRGDKEVVLEAVKQDGYALVFAGEEPRGDKEVVLEAVKQNGEALEYAGGELRRDKEVVLEAVKQNGEALEFAGGELRRDKEVVLEAVKQDGWALKYAGGKLRRDKDFVLEAVKQNGFALEFAGGELRGDKEVVLEAVKQDGRALEYAGGELSGDMENNVDQTAEIAVMTLLSNVFEGIAFLDIETIKRNIALASDGGMSKEDRSIRIGLGNYIMSHFSLIFMGLIVNEDFRNTFKEAVSVEIDKDFVSKTLNEMKDGKVYGDEGSFVINLGKYNDNIYKKINGKLMDSFDKIDGYENVIDSFASELSDDEMIDIGYCISNFMYLYRAMAQDASFVRYIKSVVHDVQKKLGIQ